MTEYAIKVEHLYKDFNKTKVLENINFLCETGKTYGLIGRNGSGKSVLMKCLCGLLQPTAGNIYISGKKLGSELEIPENMGILIEEPGYLSCYSGYKNLKFLADINRKADKDQIHNVLYKVGLDPTSKKPVSKYSMGMKQRLGIAQAIMDHPDILLLDEPMNGLDDQGCEDIRLLLQNLHTQGYTILLSSHNMEDIRLLCDEIFKIQNGYLSKTDVASIKD